MRNIFDQYSQPENRVTHAFLTALNEDRNLLQAFLTEVLLLKLPAPVRELEVLAQRYPGEEEAAELEAERLVNADDLIAVCDSTGSRGVGCAGWHIMV